MKLPTEKELDRPVVLFYSLFSLKKIINFVFKEGEKDGNISNLTSPQGSCLQTTMQREYKDHVKLD